jgi:RNA polymerase sigma-70 factor, ECF subfamily
LREQSKISRFEQTVLLHLDAAYNLARWLTRDDTDAEDVVQEAYWRAFKFFAGFHGDTGHEANRGAAIPSRAASMGV